MTELTERLLRASVGSCTCDTKSPQLQHHSEGCHYRLFEEARDEIKRWASIYVSAVKGRQAFRSALREALSRSSNEPGEDVVRALVEAAYREGWRVNAIPADEHPSGPEYVAGCEDVDWQASAALASLQSRDDDRG